MAIGAGSAARVVLQQWAPGLSFVAVVLRAVALCIGGVALYAGVAQLLGVREIAETGRILLRKFKS
jgi:hypothetical protein